MEKNSIIFNHTLEEYNKKYKRRGYRLVCLSKKEVEEFDISHNCKGEHILLKNRKWWFTKEDQCYHEIPKPIRYTWFRNLNAGVQASVCLLGAGVVATAITVPIMLLNGKEAKKEDEFIPDKPSIDPSKSQEASIAYKEKSESNYIYSINPLKDKMAVSDIESVSIGENKLSVDDDYTFITRKGVATLKVKEETIKKYKGNIIVNPVVGDWVNVTGVQVKERITFNVREIKLFKQLEVEVLPSNATDKTFKVSCKDEKITVDNDKETITASTTTTGTSLIDVEIETNEGSFKCQSEIDIVEYFEYHEIEGKKDECSIRFKTGLAALENIKEIEIPSYSTIEDKTGVYKVTEIEKDGFIGKLILINKLKLNDTLVKIGDRAFQNNSINEINFPSSLSEIGCGAFYDCTSLHAVDLSKTKITELNPYIEDETVQGCFELTSTTPIGIYCRNFVVKFPKTLKKIGQNSFLYNKNLTVVEFNEGLEIIEKQAFANTNIHTVNIPHSLIEIGDEAFMGKNNSLYSLQNVNFIDINDNLKIGAQAFAYNRNLHEIATNSSKIANINDPLADEEEELLKKRTGIFDNFVTFKIAKDIKINDSSYIGKYMKREDVWKLTITDSTISLDNYNYYEKSVEEPVKAGEVTLNYVDELEGYECTKMVFESRYCFLPNFYNDGKHIAKIKTLNLARMSDKAFHNIRLPNSIETLSEGCFYGNDGSEGLNNEFNIAMPNNLKKIGEEALSSLDGQGTSPFWLPKTLNKIGKKAFYKNWVNNIYYDGTVEEFSKIDKDDGWDEQVSLNGGGIYCTDGIYKIS